MGQRWFKTVAPAFLILIGLKFFIYDEMHVHAALKALASEHTSQVRTVDDLRRRNNDLVNEASKWRQQAKVDQERSSQFPIRESRDAVAAGSRGLARDILDFENEKTGINRRPKMLKRINFVDTGREQRDLLFPAMK